MSVLAPYISKVVSVSVRFASEAGVCDTAEGPVRYAAGDAIVTGRDEEQWPVEAALFAAKYEAAPETEAGGDGAYVKRRSLVEASRLAEPSTVVLSDGRGELEGRAGDWHVRYRDGTEAIVGAPYFEGLYEPARIPLWFRSHASLESEAASLQQLEALRESLQGTLSHTVVHWLRSTDDAKVPAWFVVTANGTHRHLHFDNTLKLPLDVLLDDSRNSRSLVAQIERLKRPSNQMRFTWSRVREFLRRLKSLVADQPEEDDDPERDAEKLLPVLAKQLVSLDMFNESIGRADAGQENYVPIPGYYQQPLEELPPASGAEQQDATLLARFLAIGAVADRRASYWQSRWQWLMLGPTERLSGSKYAMDTDAFGPKWTEPRHVERLRDHPLWLWGCAVKPANLFTLGLLAAVFFTMFAELSEGCHEDGNDFFKQLLQCHLDTWRPFAGRTTLGAYFACMVFAWLVYASTQVHQLKRRHQDCRMLAECMRVHYALVSAGVPAATVDDIPISDPASSNWVVQALRALIYQYADHPARPATTESLRQAQILFVRDQIVYHRRTLVGRRHLVLRRFRTLADLFVAVAVVMLVSLALDCFVPSREQLIPSFGRHLMVVITLAGLATWAALKRLAEAYGWDAEARRGSVVLNALRHAEHALQNEPVLDDRLDALKHCGKIFVADQAAWHNLHSARPIEAASGAA